MRRIRRSLILQIGILMAALGLGVLVLGPLRSEANRRAEVLKIALLEQLETQLNVSISYDGISPALLSVVTIRNLDITWDGGHVITEKLRIYYNPIRQFRGDSDDPLRIITRISLIDGNADIDLRSDSTGAEEASNTNFSAIDPLKLLSNKTVTVRNAVATIRTDSIYLLNAEIANLSLSHDETIIRYSFDGDTSIEDPEIYKAVGSVTSAFSARGSFSPVDSAVNGRLNLHSVNTGIFELKPQSVDFTYGSDALTVRRVNDDRPLDILLEYIDGEWAMEGEAVDLAIREIAAPGSRNPSWDRWFSSTLDGVFALRTSNETLLPVFDVNFLISVPAAMPEKSYTALVNASGNGRQLNMEELTVGAEWGRLDYRGMLDVEELTPTGILSFSLDDRFTGYPIAAGFELSEDQGAITAEPIELEAGGVSFEDFRFVVIREGESLAMSLLAVPGTPYGESSSRVHLDALLNLGSNPSVHGFASVDSVGTQSVIRLAGMNGLNGLPLISDSLFHAEGFFEANADSWVVNIDQAVLEDRDNSENRITLNGRAIPGLWALDGMHVSWEQYTFNGRGFVRNEGDQGSGEGQIIIGGEVVPIYGKWDSQGLVVENDRGFAAIIGPKDVSGRVVNVSGDSIVLPLIDGQLVADLDIRGRLGRGDWDLFINKADLAVVQRSGGANLNVSVKGTANPGRITLPQVRIASVGGELTGRGVFSSSEEDISGYLSLSGEDDESYLLDVNRSGGILVADVEIASGKMERFQPNRLAGTVNLRAKATLQGSSTKVVVDASTQNGVFDESPFFAAGKVVMDDNRIRVQDVIFDHQGISLNRGIVLADTNAGTLRSTAQIDAEFNQVPVSTGFSLGVDFNGPIDLADLTSLPFESFSGTLATKPVLWDKDPHMPAFTFQFVKNDESFTLNTPDLTVLNAEYSFASGQLEVLASEPLPLALEAKGYIKNGDLDLDINNMSLDPTLINYVMLRDPILLDYHVVFQEGRFNGDLDVTGRADNPLINGVLAAEELLVDTPYTYATIQPTDVTVRFDGHRVSVDRLEVPVGDGIAYGEGYLVLENGTLTDFNMTYGGKGTNRSDGVPIYYPMMGVYLDGRFTGEITMVGDSQSFYLEGGFQFPYLKASLGAAVVPVPQRKPGQLPTPVYLDFDFTTGNNCTFFLPNEQLKIVRATAEPNQTVNFTYSTVPETMSFTGTIPIKSGNIFYFDRDFQVTEGSLRFNEGLVDFDPMMDFRAETRVRDAENEDVTVALVYNAPVKSDFNPTVETIPARSDLEILELFGQAVVPYGENSGGDASTVILATGGMFAQAGLVQPFEEVLRESLNLDMVTIRTDIIENTLSEGLTRGDGTNTSAGTSGLGRYLDNTSLYAGKYIGNALFVSGTVSATYFDGQRNRSVFGGLEFETAVSLEMETPFFNIAWSYSPDPTIEQNFIADNEISLKWQFSY